MWASHLGMAIRSAAVIQRRIMPPKLDNIDHVHIYVTDRGAAERWYKEVLGFERIPAYEFWAADGGPLTLTNPSGSIHIALFERLAEARHATIAFGVTAQAFLDWRAHLSSVLKEAVELEDHQLSWSMYFSDPDGNPYEITTYEYKELTEKGFGIGG